MGIPAGGGAFVLFRPFKRLILLGSEKHDGNLVEVFPGLGARCSTYGSGARFLWWLVGVWCPKSSWCSVLGVQMVQVLIPQFSVLGARCCSTQLVLGSRWSTGSASDPVGQSPRNFLPVDLSNLKLRRRVGLNLSPLSGGVCHPRVVLVVFALTFVASRETYHTCWIMTTFTWGKLLSLLFGPEKIACQTWEKMENLERMAMARCISHCQTDTSLYYDSDPASRSNQSEP